MSVIVMPLYPACQVRNGQPLPADVVVIATSEEEDICYVETSQIDGETNLKLHRAPGPLLNSDSNSATTGSQNTAETSPGGNNDGAQSGESSSKDTHSLCHTVVSFSTYGVLFSFTLSLLVQHRC